MNDSFCTIEQYLESPSVLKSKIARYDALIEAFEIKMVASVGQSGYLEMQMDDGQMKVRSTYRSMKELEDALHALEKARQRYINRFNGRISVLRGGNF